MYLKKILGVKKRKKTRKKRRRKMKIKMKKKIKKELLKETFFKHALVNTTLIICLFILSKRFKKNIGDLLGSFFFASLIGYIVHILSHLINYTDLYKKSENIFKYNKYSDYFIKLGCRFMDFHSITHHDSEINKKPINILYESINNAFFQGLGLLIFINIISKLDYSMVIFWVLFYVTVHNINFNIKPSWIHRNHHIKPLTNISFGFDFWDIMFGTGNSTESRPDMALNVIAITVLLYYIVPYFK